MEKVDVMSRSSRFAGRIRILTAALGVAALSVILSCSDSPMAPASQPEEDGIYVVSVEVPDSLKNPSLSAAGSMMASVGVSTSGSFSQAAVGGYTVAPVPFAPEPAATLNMAKTCDDCVTFNVPIGFTFNFYGVNYSKLAISSNGFVGFNPDLGVGCCAGAAIPFEDGSSRNNLIALAWSDWVPSTGIRYETRGVAPNRKFVLQFKASEYANLGSLDAQMVLSEGSNEITIYTTSLKVVGRTHLVTQGIENASGTEAAFLAGRVKALLLNLSNDAVRFSPVVQNKAPVITAPANIVFSTGEGACSAKGDVGLATASDDKPGVILSGVRSDGLGLDEPYPRGVTSINWTATDVEGWTASAVQNVTVNDAENPSLSAPADIVARVNVGVSFASVAVGAGSASDNCPNPVVSSKRSDGAPLTSGYPIGVTTITWTATDVAGNSVSSAQTITVSGNKAPVLSVPPSLSVNADPGACAASVSVGTATATDDVAGVVITSKRSDGLELGAAYPKGVTVITWKATDAEGLSDNGSQSVTVSDKELPRISAPADVMAETSPGLASAMVSVSAPSAADNCPNVSVKGVRNDGLALFNAYPVGVTRITWTATDGSLNSASAVQIVTVVDREAPVLNVPSNMSVNATSKSGAVVNYYYSASDNVGVVSQGCVASSGSLFAAGTSTVNCSAADAAGNHSSKSFTITVLGAHEQLGNLITLVSSLNLSNGLKQSLVSQLETAYRDPGSNAPHVACNKMGDFVSQVERKSREIGSAAATLIADAQRIMNVMGCE